MSIYKTLPIKSKIRDYSVNFTDSFTQGLGAGDKKLFIIIDRNVKSLYENELAKQLANFPHLEIEAVESTKTLESAKSIIRYLIDNNMKRDISLVAIGGGITQDIASFAASIIYRGINWIFVPTTLLAQSDSCIGSKTSINVDEYKNQVGNFYPPGEIYLNVKYLKTLNLRDVKSGLGEIIKVHLIDGEESLDFILDNYDKSLSDEKIMSELIFRSLEIKKRVIEIDEFDTDYRNIMNYGHTFGHALESITNYELCHGQAITIGMDISNYLSWKAGYINEDLFKKMRKILLKNWPSYNLKEIDLDSLVKSLSKDKKNIGDKVTAILNEGPGKMMKISLGLDELKGKINSYFANFIYK